MVADSFKTIKSSIKDRYQKQKRVQNSEITIQNIKTDIRNMASSSFDIDDDLMNMIGLQVQRR